MLVTAKIYEGVEGLRIDCILYDKTRTPVDYTTITSSHLLVLRPGSNEEETWETIPTEPNILRHTVPTGALITAGKYKIQPYIETSGGFKGLWGMAEMTVTRKWK